MADLKFGGVTPGTGDIKVGSSNASKIYQGSTLLWPLGVAPQPGEVTICDLIWTKTNSTITATTTGGTIPITTDATGWGQAIENQQPAACWYKNDQATYGYLGLFYNKFCLDVIQPPAGFRLPTSTDWTDTRSCVASGQPQINYANQIVNNYYDLWPSAVNSLSDINTIDFNSIGGGSISASKFSGSNYYQSFWNTDRAYYWHSSQTSTNPRTALGIIHAYNSSNNYVYLNNLSSTTSSSLVYNSNGFNIRFVKDVPVVTNTGIYGNFTGLPDDTQSGTPNIYTQTSQTYFNSSNNQQNRVATSIITNSTYDEFRFKAKVNSGSLTMNSVQIFAYSDSARTNLVAQTNPWTGPLAMTSSYQDPWGSLTLSTPGTYFLKVSFNLTSSGQQGYQLTLT
jgi:uncharacterized protein (TIGR02145 family)